MTGTKLTGLGAMTAGLMGMVRAIPGVALLGTALKAVGAAIVAIGGTISAPVVAVLAAIAAAGFLIFKYWDRVSSVMAGVGRAIGEQLAPALEMARPVLEWLAPVGDLIAKGWAAATSALKSFGEWLGGFFGREVLSDGQKAEWEQAGYKVATAMIEAVKTKVGELVSWFATLPSRIAAAIGRIDLAGLIKWPSLPAWLGGGGAAPAAPAGQNTPARAAGGHVNRGRSYLVGEHRPEIFTPSRDGYIGSRAPAASAPTVHAPISVSVTITGAGLHEIADRVKREVSESVRAGLRGAMADTGLGIA